MAADENTSGKLVIFGTVAWDHINRKGKPGKKEEDTLLGPHLVRELVDVRVKRVATGPNSCHSFVITEDNQVWGFGRNERGQLGLGHKDIVELPVNLSEQVDVLKNKKIVRIATGRNHSLLVTDIGEVYAAGDNKLGQLGISTLNDQTNFAKVTSLANHKIIDVACGAEFSLVLTDKHQVYAFGSQEYGQLGNGETGQYIKSAGQMNTQPQSIPLLVKALSERKIISIACGTSHSLAMDDDGYVYSWGFGGYGRLGHGEQKDLLVPKVIPNLSKSHRESRATQIACGSTCSLALDGNTQMLLWGKWKTTGDGSSGQPWMNPRYLYDLNGWNLRCIAAGDRSLFALAEDEKSTIAWGQVLNGELGFGEDSPNKSATTPQKVEPLEGIKSLQVSCGLGHTLLIVQPDSELVPELPKWPILPETDDWCVKCHKEDNEEQLLLCDKCDKPMHSYCANPPLKEIPDGEWYCDTCHPPLSESKSRKRTASQETTTGKKKSKTT
ncbi:regulator of chromosome condensation 1/beta-lactamase-inhibitor protein II [Halteromyces radiatus]|uniref:regulator of chromosome condensation 1/beta-lactamase-inhibitor protein II n=1 Tax=Halteromyces radiatus TaxID=101107 RepID=UPI00222128A6|nr:regulator of chromosome condensation 1/beta-lactamase-inhibitor protein II [Halteromyces radiatus]KAI8086120.1 regulator of chromosome condensation 1/beta-lactamase-inhibitor protein II [Halteromyces radiatus]